MNSVENGHRAAFLRPWRAHARGRKADAKELLARDFSDTFDCYHPSAHSNRAATT